MPLDISRRQSCKINVRIDLVKIDKTYMAHTEVACAVLYSTHLSQGVFLVGIRHYYSMILGTLQCDDI